MTAPLNPVDVENGGTVTVHDELDDFKQSCRFMYAYLEQDEVWIPQPPRPRIAIADMDKEWRLNASRWLERRAGLFAARYAFGEIYCLSAPTMRAVIGEVKGVPVEAGPLLSHLDLMSDSARDDFDRWQDERNQDPEAWIRTTPLHRALVASLPSKSKELAELAGRAAHWSTCPVRLGSGSECQCRHVAAHSAGGGR